MRFFTREAYMAMQELPGDDSSDEAFEARAAQRDREWDCLLERYTEHLTAIKPCLPGSMQEFTEVCLHDGKVTSAVLWPDKVAVLNIAGEGYWGPRFAEHADVFEAARAELKDSDASFMALPRIGPSSATVMFAGVEAIEGLEEMVGDWWVYDEVHLSDDGGFDYRVLLEKSEFRVVAKEVTFMDHGYS